MRAGKLRHRIDVIRKATTTDASGFPTEAWTVQHENIPASFRAMTANERMAAAQRQSESTVEFEIRAGLDINPEDKIRFNGRIWNIDPVLPDPTLQRTDRIQAADPEAIQTITVS